MSDFSSVGREADWMMSAPVTLLLEDALGLRESMADLASSTFEMLK